MEEEIKKRGRGRPRKGEVVPKKKRKKEHRGGVREGAGRKKGTYTAYEGDTLSEMLSLRVRGVTKRRVQDLRELTKHDDMPFNRLFEAWVEELAKNYGLEDE